MYKLLATDVDGTITDEYGRLHVKALQAIRKLEEKGVPVILVSGRPLPFIESLSLFLGTTGPLIAENGAVVKINGKKTLNGDSQIAKDSLSLLQKSFSINLDEDNQYRIVDISIKKDLDPEKVQNFIEEKKLPVSLLVTNVMLHLVDSRVSKGKALIDILKEMGVNPEQTIVSGDSYNDLPLFEVGALNLAVGNAEPDLKRKAHRIAKAQFGEGFAELVNEVFI